MKISNRYVMAILGSHRPFLEIVGSISFALMTFVYAFTASSFFNLRIFTLQDRVTYDFLFHQSIISEHGDQILIVGGSFVWLMSFLRGGKTKSLVCGVYGALAVLAIFPGMYSLLSFMALMSVPLIGGTLIYDRFALKGHRILDWSWNLYLNYVLIIALIIGILSLVFSLTFIIPSSLSIPQTTNFIHDYAYEIFLMLSVFSPILIVLLVFCIPQKLAINELLKWWTHRRQQRNQLTHQHNDKADLYDSDPISNINKETSSSVNLMNERSRTKKNILKNRTRLICVVLSMILSIALTSIPHNPMINANDSIIGVDTHYYVSWTKNLTISAQQGSMDLLQKAFMENRGDRPLSLLIIFFFVNLFGSPGELAIDKYLPLFLAPILVLAVYFMTRQMTSNEVISILAAFLTSVSYHILIGIYAGFFANWIALIIGYVSIGFLFRFLNKLKKLDLTIFFVGMVALMFAHIYTWTVFVLVISIFLLVMLKMNIYLKKSILILLLVVFSSVAIDISKSLIVGGSVGVQHDLRIMEEFGVESNTFSERWDLLIYTIQRFLGGLFANPIILLLGLYWLVKCNYKTPVNILVLLFLSTGMIPLFIGDWMIQARLFYIIPFQLPASIALATLLGRIMYERQNSKWNDLRPDKQPPPLNNTMILLVVCIWLVSMSIKALANFVPYI